MGTDIHLHAEVKQNGIWKSAVPIEPHPECWYENILDKECNNLGIQWHDYKYSKLKLKYQKMSKDEILSNFFNNEIIWYSAFDKEFNQRNYRWFGVLCGVRGEYEQNFGDVRGLPNDVSSEIKMVSDNDIEGYLHHWITLQELLDFNWNKTIRRTGYFSLVSFYHQINEILDNKITYFPDHPGYNINEISSDLMIKYIMGHRDFYQERGRYYAKIERDITYKQEIGEEYLDKLFTKLNSFGKPENIRIICWFS